MCNLPAKFRFLLRLNALNLLQAQKLSGRAKVFRLALPSFLTGFWASPLNQERATAFPFCLGEGLWCVGGRVEVLHWLAIWQHKLDASAHLEVILSYLLL